ncbi:carbohydrate ABC transporter permease [Caldicellulosiruptor acetigenus]|uniref:carbohydrate ABC transporter permease n=1 Tax=Caldicellulosiruptor acetigenus TaxID=301953 RepID=UPI00041C0920|nr:carbohydrate ABC transporter permease [Caldicellulosiruptor acetigenus]WAM36029.1 carbohydrate ABC transporter permease [Caldicellulosiruptor acetigenus]
MTLKRILSRIGSLIINAFVMLLSLSCIFPIVWLIYSSLKTEKEFVLNIAALPAHPTFENYINAIKTAKMHIYFFNSLFTTVVSVILIVLFSFVVGYFFARYRFTGRNLLYTMFLAGMLIPIHALLVPMFVEFKVLGLLDKRITLILPYVGLGLPMAIFLMENFIKDIPHEIEEAAYIDGATLTTTLFRIILPICKPIISTVVILSSLSSWNEFSFALVLIKSDALKTLPVGLTNFTSQYTVKYTQLMAAITIAILPVIMVYLIFNKKVIQGLVAGAVKG